MKLAYKRRALRHLASIHDHIAEDNPRAAIDVVRSIAHSVERLRLLPLSARVGPIKDTRLLAVPGLPYIVVYRIRGETVEVVAILHTRQHQRR